MATAFGLPALRDRFGSPFRYFGIDGEEAHRVSYPGSLQNPGMITKAVSKRPHSKGSADLIYGHASFKLFKNRNVVSFEQAERGCDDPMLQRRIVWRAERIAHRERDEQSPRRFDRRGDFTQKGN
jgi:hypothetical protein